MKISTQNTIRKVNKSMQPLLAICLLMFFAVSGYQSQAQFSIAATATNYTENFNSLVNTGAGTWTNNSTLTGWYARTDATATITTCNANTGSTTAAGLYSYGTNTVSERALGYAASNAFVGPSGTGKAYIGWRLVNNTGSAVSSVTVTWTGEQWRKDNTVNQSLVLTYRQASSVTDLTTGSYTAAGSTFTSPIITAGGSALDGNLAANRVAGISVTITVNIPAGEELMIRWEDLNDTGNDHQMAIDDVTINAAAAASLPTVTTTTASAIMSMTASSGGDVTADGGASVTARGVAYGTAANPTTSGTVTSDGTGTGVFVSSIGGLTPNTQYFYRAYATNSAGTAYGSESDFTTLASTPVAPIVNSPTSASLNVSIGGGDGNPSTTQYAIRETGSGNYVQADGTRAAGEVWQTAGTWLAITVTGLTASTLYNFDVKARNSLNAETGFGPTGSGTTSAAGAQNQTITFNPLTNVTYGDANFNLTATASSGLTVTYMSSNTNVATISGNTVSIVGAGTTTITASQAGDINWNPAPNVDQNLTVDPKNLTTSGAAAQNKPYDGNTTAVISGTTLVGVEPGDVVTVSGGGTFATANAGTGIAVTANLSLGGADQANYTLTQPTGLSADISQASQTITFNPLSNKTTADAPFALTATASSGLTVTYTSSNPLVADVTGNTVTIFSVGSTIITAQQAGDANYLAATDVPQTQLVTAAPSMVTYSFGSVAPGTALPTAGTPVASLSFSDITRGNNNGTTTLLTTTSASSGYAGVSGSYNAGAATLTGALNTGTSAYFEFTLTPAVAHQVTLTGISFGSRSTSTGPQAYTLRSSLDGYASDLATGTVPNTSAWVLRTNSFTATSSFGTAVTFRLFGHSGTGSPSANTANWRVDDIKLSVFVDAAPQCTGTPEAGTASGDVTFCGSGSTTINLTGNTDINTASGLSIQWYISTDNMNFSPTGVGNETALATGTVSQTSYYYAEVACSFSTLSDVSNTVTITVNPASAVTSVTGNSSICVATSTTYTANGVVLGLGTGTWSSDNTLVATVNPLTGLVNGVGAGTANITYTITGGCNGTVSASAAVTVASGAVPTVTGVVNVCPFIGVAGPAGQLTYTATAVGATAFTWTVPPTNVTIVSGQGTANLVISLQNGFAAQANKQLRVTATSACGVSAQTIYYLLAQLPTTPLAITGPTSACPFIGVGTATYSIAAVASATSYNWVVPANASIVSGQGTTSITVSFNGSYATGAITVNAQNDCGVSSNRSITVTRNNPSTPSLIAGPTNACPFITPNTAASYSIPAVVAATTYTWSATNGATIVTGQGTTNVTISYPIGYTSGTISVTASNGCGTSSPRNLAISTLNPAAPGVIDVVNTVACPNRQYTYTIATYPSNTTNLIWTVPDAQGAVIVSGQGTTSITVSYPATTVLGVVTVQAFSPCGQSVIRSTNVMLPACPMPRSTPSFSRAGNNTDQTMDLNVYPNPTTSQFNVQVITAAKSQITARVFDMQGKLVTSFLVRPNQTVNFGNQLKAGAYILELVQQHERSTKRIIKF